MTLRLFFTSLLLFTAISSPAQEGDTPYPPFETLFSPGQYNQYVSKPKYKDRIDLLRKIIESRASLLHKQLDRRDLNEVKQVLSEFRALTHYAQEEPSRSTASPDDLRSKQIKKMEIMLRKQLDSMNDMKLSVPFDFRSEFEITIQAIEQLRDQLLRGLFYQDGTF